MLNISQVIHVRNDSNLCRKELTVHWSAPNSRIRIYPQPCTNSMWGDESEAVAPIIWLYQTVDAWKEEVFFPDLLITLRRHGEISTPDPQSPWLSEGVGSGWSGLYDGPLRPYTCEPYPTQLVCRELRPEGLVAWCPGMLRYGWQVHNMAHKSPGSIYILWPRPTW